MRTAQLGVRIALVAVLASIVVAIPAGAQTDISITFDELVFGAPGSVRQVEVIEVDESLVGLTCELAVHAENQSSVHIGNDLIVSTGSSEAVVVGVEDTPNGGTDQVYDMVIGPTIVVQIRIGQDGMSSLGFGLSFDCTQPPVETEPPPDLGQQVVTAPATTTTIPPPPPTTPVPTTAPPTTTTTTTVPPTVAGAVTNGLPETPPARAVPGSPAYTG